MAITAKPMHEVDRRVAAILLREANQSGQGRRAIAAKAGMSMNRLGKILRQEAPPASVGELASIAAVFGLTASAILEQAEASVLNEDADALMDEPAAALAAAEGDIEREQEQMEESP